MHGRLVSSGFTLGAGEQRCSAELQQDPERKMTLTLLIVDPKYESNRRTRGVAVGGSGVVGGSGWRNI